MTNAWIVEVESMNRTSGLPTHEYYASAFETAERAQEAVRQLISATDELVVTRAQLRSAAVQALGLRPGQILPMTGLSGSA